MHLLYSLALFVVSLVLLPYFIYHALRQGKYIGSLKQRLGSLPAPARSNGRATVWVHAVSVGEFNAARTLLASLKREMPGYRVVVSTTTLTGQQLARADSSALIDAVFYFPFDWAFIVRRVIRRVSPDLVVILETELWPNFLRQSRKLDVATVIVNGRISPRSFARYNRVRFFIKQVINDASLLVMQSEADRERALALGAHPSRVRVCGNLKYDIAEAAETNLHDELDKQLALSSSARLIVAGSTAPGEEMILLDALKQARAQRGLHDARLLIAPRHPERFNEVADLISKSGFRLARRTEMRRAAIKGDDSEVILLDTIGELIAVYRFAAVVFVGGSLVPRGGHNIIEPALYKKPIIVGPHMDNFRQIVADFSRANALVQVSSTIARTEDGFASEVIRLLADRETAQRIGARAFDILMKNRGATECAVAALREALSERKA